MLVAAKHTRHLQRSFRRLGCSQRPNQHADGIAAVLMDVDPRVPAHQALDRDAHRNRGSRRLLMHDRQPHDVVPAASTPDRDGAPLLGIEIEHDLGLEHRRVQVVRACQACLLVHREEALEGWQGHVRAGLHQRQTCRRSDPVVSSQRRAIRLDPCAVTDEFDGILPKIVLHSLVGFGHHIHVRLHQNRRCRFPAPRAWLVHHKVSDSILLPLQPELIGKVLNGL
mmetsp:Transcript_21017/g.49746  ORF Transcript_21017/g.49746 Transcript_21017/m.49746 type:complete len:225 (+) Transcript_21017:906-1580(+)